MFYLVRMLCLPLSFVLVEDLALGVVTDRLDVDEAPDVELLGPEHRHLERRARLLARSLCSRVGD